MKSLKNDREDIEPQAQADLVLKHVNMLAEHFDSVQILVSTLTPNGSTRNIEIGSGNVFARYGQAREWLESGLERARVDVRNQNEDE